MLTTSSDITCSSQKEVLGHIDFSIYVAQGVLGLLFFGLIVLEASLQKLDVGNL